MKAKNVRPYDLERGVTDTAELLNDAIAKITGARALREDPRQAKRVGRKGGLAKGVAADAKRNAVMAEDIVQRLCEHSKLTWDDCAAILGKPWSATTLRRKFRF